MNSPALPDPLRFVLHALEAEGALVERTDNRATALLPHELSSRMGLPEEAHLAIYPEQMGEIAAGIGSPLLEKLVGEARKMAPKASIRVALEQPRPSQVRSIAERFTLRNGLVEIVDITMGVRGYLVAMVAYAIEADDRREGLLSVIAAPDGGEPEPALGFLLDLRSEDSRIEACPPRVDVSLAARWIAIRAEPRVRRACEGAVVEIKRRQARDRERIADYFEQLAAEAAAPRRKTEPRAIEAKVSHLLAERDKKIEGLYARYAARIHIRVAALWVAEVPAANVSMRLSRRKAERVITVVVPAGAHAADLLACEACAAPTGKPAACDDAVHLLCEVCAPSAQGRVVCAACRRR